MSQTLGEKLRQARESRGLSISEVADQTRISPHYLESIENDDYKILPGGIFNKGFIKSYAKYVGVDDKEAIADYTRLISERSPELEDEQKTYRPQVLTDDYAQSTSLGTKILIVAILGIIGVAGFYLFNYIQNQPSAPTIESANSNANANVANVMPAANSQPTPIPVDGVKVELTATSLPISVSYSVDDAKRIEKIIAVNEPLILDAKNNVKLSYYKGFTPDKVKLIINGKEIAPPIPPKGNYIFDVNKENVANILKTGTFEPSAAPAASPQIR